MSRHWQKIGVELEGGWQQDPRELLEYSHLVDVKGDGSVSRALAPHVGEVTVGPYDRLDRLEDAMLHCYPHKVDKSCGMHVHTSFDRPTILRLCSPAFFEHFKSFWAAWGKKNKIAKVSPFWSRLAGRNRYCHLPVKDECYGWQTFSHYSMLNFGAYAEHGTLECRLLPMFQKKDIALKAARALVECYESYLADDDMTGQRAPVQHADAHLGHPGDSAKSTQDRAKQKLERFKKEKEQQRSSRVCTGQSVNAIVRFA